MPGKSLILSAGFFFLLLIIPSLSSAATSTGFGGRRALLALRDIHSSVYLEYQFDRSYSYGKNDNKFSSHAFTEEFTVSGNYSLYRPEFWRGSYKVTLGSSQIESFQNGLNSGRSSNLQKKYEFYADLFYLSRTPVTIKSVLRDTRVERRFAESYSLWAETHSANLRIKNKILPANISYATSQTETAGLSYNRVTDAQSIALAMSHQLSSIMITGMGYTRTQNTAKVIELGSTVRNDRAVTRVNNTLNFPYGRMNLSLMSTYHFSEISGEDQGKERFWEETLDWKPGRALRVELVHNERVKTALGLTTEDISNRGSLVYSLYQSLSLSLHLAETDRIFQNGQQGNESVVGRVTYKKDLHQGRRFTLNLEQGFEQLTRELATSTQNILGEPLIIDFAGGNFLENPNVFTGSVEVRDVTDTFAYFEGIDYALNSFGDLTEIEILPGSAISDGDALLINYSFLVNPSIAYTTDRSFVSTVLSLYDGKLRFTGRYSTAERNRTSGTDDLVSLNSMRLYSLGVIGRFKPYRFDLNYTDTDTTNYILRQVEVSGGYEATVAGGALLLDLSNVYQVFHAEESSATNRVSSRAIFRNRLTRNTTMKTEAEGQIITGEDINRKTFALKIDLKVRHRKTVFALNLEERYLDHETKNAWKESIMLSMLRTF